MNFSHFVLLLLNRFVVFRFSGYFSLFALQNVRSAFATPSWWMSRPRVGWRSISGVPFIFGKMLANKWNRRNRHVLLYWWAIWWSKSMMRRNNRWSRAYSLSHQVAIRQVSVLFAISNWRHTQVNTILYYFILEIFSSFWRIRYRYLNISFPANKYNLSFIF